MKDGYHHGSLEGALLDAAVAQVREHGTAQVSLRGLAKQVGVSPSAAYQHFPDKASLLVAVGLRAFDQLEARMRRELSGVDAGGDLGAVMRFAAVGRAYVAYALEEPNLFRHMFGAAMCGTAPEDVFVPTPEASLETSLAAIREAVASGTATSHGDGAHGILLEALADLSRRGLLREGIGDGLDVVAWSLVHGFSSLVVEGHMPREAEDMLISLAGRLVLRDEAYAVIAAAETQRSAAQPAEEPAGA